MRNKNMFSQTENPNFIYAQFGMQFSKERFPLGGINRKDIFDKNTEEIIPQLKILDILRKQYKCSCPDGNVIAENMKQLKGAFCGELSAEVRLAILKKFPQACVELISFNFHELILIGRKRGNPKDINTWIDTENEGYFLDIWSDEIYPISELPNKKKNPIIPFYSFGGPNGLILHNVHYLTGNPVVLATTNQHNDQDDISIKVLLNQKNNAEPKVLYANGVAAFRKQDYSCAVREINKALVMFKINNSYIEIITCYSTLTSCYRELMEYDQAINYCTQAIILAKKQDNYPNLELKKLEDKYACIEKLYKSVSKIM